MVDKRLRPAGRFGEYNDDDFRNVEVKRNFYEGSAVVKSEKILSKMKPFHKPTITSQIDNYRRRLLLHQIKSAGRQRHHRQSCFQHCSSGRSKCSYQLRKEQGVISSPLIGTNKETLPPWLRPDTISSQSSEALQASRNWPQPATVNELLPLKYTFGMTNNSCTLEDQERSINVCFKEESEKTNSRSTCIGEPATTQSCIESIEHVDSHPSSVAGCSAICPVSDEDTEEDVGLKEECMQRRSQMYDCRDGVSPVAPEISTEFIDHCDSPSSSACGDICRLKGDDPTDHCEPKRIRHEKRYSWMTSARSFTKWSVTTGTTLSSSQPSSSSFTPSKLNTSCDPCDLSASISTATTTVGTHEKRKDKMRIGRLLCRSPSSSSRKKEWWVVNPSTDDFDKRRAMEVDVFDEESKQFSKYKVSYDT